MVHGPGPADPNAFPNVEGDDDRRRRCASARRAAAGGRHARVCTRLQRPAESRPVHRLRLGARPSQAASPLSSDASRRRSHRPRIPGDVRNDDFRRLCAGAQALPHPIRKWWQNIDSARARRVSLGGIAPCRGSSHARQAQAFEGAVRHLGVKCTAHTFAGWPRADIGRRDQCAVAHDRLTRPNLGVGPLARRAFTCKVRAERSCSECVPRFPRCLDCYNP
jgi:hypothetical protein